MTTTYHITDIRNIALAGHGASGKTSLADALLYAAGATDRRGSVDDGTSLSDVEDEEKRRHFTIDCHLLHLEWAEQADPPDRLARLSRLHRQRPERPGRRRERRRDGLGARPASRSTPGASSTRPPGSSSAGSSP